MTKMRHRKLHVLAAGIIVPLLLLEVASCGNHSNPSPQEAQRYFSTHRHQLNDILNMVNVCVGMQELYANDTSMNNIFGKCIGKNDEYRDKIIQFLRQAGLLAVKLSWDKKHLNTVSFVMTSYIHFGDAGGSEIWYFSTPMTEVETAKWTNDVVPLTAYPCQWFFEYSSTKMEREKPRGLNNK